MTGFTQLLLIGVAANLDNLGVGVAYGVRRIKVPPVPNLIIAAVAFGFTWVSVWFGGYIARFLSDLVANSLGALLLIAVGIWVMAAQWRQREPTPQPQPAAFSPSVVDVWQQPERADSDRSGAISIRESLVLGVALSINCFTNGFTAGLWKLGALSTSLSTASFSYLALWLGAWLGVRYAARWLGNKATFAAGCLLILLGLHQFF